MAMKLMFVAQNIVWLVTYLVDCVQSSSDNKYIFSIFLLYFFGLFSENHITAGSTSVSVYKNR